MYLSYSQENVKSLDLHSPIRQNYRYYQLILSLLSIWIRGRALVGGFFYYCNKRDFKTDN